MGDGAWVYILASKRNGTLYVGVTTNLPARISAHRGGAVAGFTSSYGVKQLVHLEHYPELTDARQREWQLKGWRRKWKLELIEAENPRWRDLFEDMQR